MNTNASKTIILGLMKRKKKAIMLQAQQIYDLRTPQKKSGTKKT